MILLGRYSHQKRHLNPQIFKITTWSFRDRIRSVEQIETTVTMKKVVSWLNHFITLGDEMKRSCLKNEEGNLKENERFKKLPMF